MGLGAIAAATLLGVGVQAYQAHKQAQENTAMAKEAKETAIKQKQAEQEQSPQLASAAGLDDAVKKRKTSYGIEESIINNNLLASANTIGQRETWG